jgi:hypothetical protein
MTPHFNAQDAWQELTRRSVDGLEVILLWSQGTGETLVRVEDARVGEAFEVPVGSAKPLDVFHHPYAYAARLGVEYAVLGRASAVEGEEPESDHAWAEAA